MRRGQDRRNLPVIPHAGNTPSVSCCNQIPRQPLRVRGKAMPPSHFSQTSNAQDTNLTETKNSTLFLIENR